MNETPCCYITNEPFGVAKRWRAAEPEAYVGLQRDDDLREALQALLVRALNLNHAKAMLDIETGLEW